MTTDKTICESCNKKFQNSSDLLRHKYGCHDLETESYIARYKRIRKEIPEKYLDAYEKITGSGKAPKIFQASVCYIETEKSQDTICELFETNAVSLRNCVRDIVEHGAVTLEYVQENCERSGTKGQFNGKDGQCGGNKVKHGL